MLTDDLTGDIAAAGNRYRWPGHHRRTSPHHVRRGFFVGTAAGTGMVVAAIAFPLRTEDATVAALFVEAPPAVIEPEPDHVDVTEDCPACVDLPQPPDEPTTQAGPTDTTPVHIEPVEHVARHRRADVTVPRIPEIVVTPTPTHPVMPTPQAEPTELPTEPEPEPTEEPVPPNAPPPGTPSEPTTPSTPEPTDTIAPSPEPSPTAPTDAPTDPPQPPPMPIPTTAPEDTDTPEET